ncbi:DUF4126 family protein [Synechococcus sp. R55.3]|uniref:DUF4126 family protein n=2 Tax=unclassified Synechococcus TaxID=2626047 RepID=UPI0039C37356
MFRRVQRECISTPINAEDMKGIPAIFWGLGLSFAFLCHTGDLYHHTGGLGNPLLATGENVTSLLLAVVAVLAPWLAVLLMGLLVYWLGKRALKLGFRSGNAAPKSQGSPPTAVLHWRRS